MGKFIPKVLFSDPRLSKLYLAVLFLGLSPMPGYALQQFESFTSIDINSNQDSLTSVAIKDQLNGPLLKELNFPKSVYRFYEKQVFKPVWAQDLTEAEKTWKALMMLDCVLQFGLSHADYHPNELRFEQFNTILKEANLMKMRERIRFEIMLTDAMLSIINHLHFGKLNPECNAFQIDSGNMAFEAGTVLTTAIAQKDLMATILKVQPQSKAYALLQDYMRLIKGQYQEDCYEVPEGDVQKIAINMERLRWAAIDETTYIQINIPAYNLSFYKIDTTYQFKVIVGKPGNKTPALHSHITHLTTAPEWKVPHRIFVNELLPKAIKNPNYLLNNNMAIYNGKGEYVKPTPNTLKRIKASPKGFRATQSSGCDNALGLVVFRFPNLYDVYLHDTPEKSLFNRSSRALSHGCMRVENATQLAALLLRNDGQSAAVKLMQNAVKNYQTKTFHFKKALPIKIVYLTCEIKDGMLMKYQDIYQLDDLLQKQFYQADQTPVASGN